jgi:hypothetical protein
MIRRAGIRRQIRREADHVLKTTIKTQYGTIADVLCRIYLPRSVMARPYLHFEPTPEQLNALTVPEFSVEGKAEWLGQSIAIRAGTVFTEGWQQNRVSPDIVECTLPGEPWDLEIRKQRAAEAESAPIQQGVFWLTPNMLLSPALLRTVSYTGDVNIKTAHETSFLLPCGRVHFRKHFRHQKTSRGSLSSSELVAQFDGPLEPALLGEVVNQLDDLLLLASLATRHKSVCRGWNVHTDNTESLVYRSRLAPPKPRTIGEQETLIDRPDFDDFLLHAYAAFRQSPAHERLRQAINLLLTADEGDLVTSFLKVFAALETIVTFHRETAGLVTILKPEVWASFEKDLTEFIKQHTSFKDDSLRRRLIYEKRSELNRIAFGTAFSEAVSLLQKQGLTVEDLWPVIGSSRGLSLAEIRNRMVHGVVFTPTQEGGLFAAKIHLAWCVERLLLAFLGWPLERSLVGNFLKHMTAYNDWKDAQQALSK